MVAPRRLAALMAGFSLAGTHAHAEPATPSSEAAHKACQEVEARYERVQRQVSDCVQSGYLKPDVLNDAFTSAPSPAAGRCAGLAGAVAFECVEASASTYRQVHQAYAHRNEVFQWQLRSNQLIFWVVLFVVANGLLLSWWQFLKARAMGNQPHRQADSRKDSHTQTASIRDADAQVENSSERTNELSSPSDIETHVELSPKGMKISSPVLGVVILGMSLGFFYLYLAFVYPVSALDCAPPKEVPTQKE